MQPHRRCESPAHRVASRYNQECSFDEAMPMLKAWFLANKESPPTGKRLPRFVTAKVRGGQSGHLRSKVAALRLSPGGLVHGTSSEILGTGGSRANGLWCRLVAQRRQGLEHDWA